MNSLITICSTVAFALAVQGSGLAQSIAGNFPFDGDGKDVTGNGQQRMPAGTYEPAEHKRASGDTKQPKNKVTYPKNGRDVASEVMSVTGAAKDNVGIAAVWYSLDGDEWRLATSYDNWTNWMALNLDLTPGLHTFQTFAVDTSGNASATNTVQFNYLTWSGSWTGVCKTGAGDVAVRMSLTQTGDSVTGYLVQDGSAVGAGILSDSLVDGIAGRVKWPLVYPDTHKDALIIQSSQHQVSFWLTINRNGISGSESGAFEGTIKLHRN